jgi:hypothetical protein
MKSTQSETVLRLHKFKYKYWHWKVWNISILWKLYRHYLANGEGILTSKVYCVHTATVWKFSRKIWKFCRKPRKLSKVWKWSEDQSSDNVYNFLMQLNWKSYQSRPKRNCLNSWFLSVQIETVFCRCHYISREYIGCFQPIPRDCNDKETIINKFYKQSVYTIVITCTRKGILGGHVFGFH